MLARSLVRSPQLLALLVTLAATLAACLAVAPGIANAGESCPESARLFCGSSEVDFCPGSLNPGFQEFGTQCIVETAPVDVCPDALNPGNQPVGTTCAVAPAAPPVQPVQPTQPTAANLGPDTDPAVDVDHDPTFGNGPAVVDGIDSTEIVVADVSGIDTDATGGGDAGVNGGAAGTNGATAAGTTATPTGSLPYTGLGLGSLALLGCVALVLGGLARRDATRVARARA